MQAFLSTNRPAVPPLAGNQAQKRTHQNKRKLASNQIQWSFRERRNIQTEHGTRPTQFCQCLGRQLPPLLRYQTNCWLLGNMLQPLHPSSISFQLPSFSELPNNKQLAHTVMSYFCRFQHQSMTTTAFDCLFIGLYVSSCFYF